MDINFTPPPPPLQHRGQRRRQLRGQRRVVQWDQARNHQWEIHQQDQGNHLLPIPFNFDAINAENMDVGEDVNLEDDHDVDSDQEEDYGYKCNCDYADSAISFQ